MRRGGGHLEVRDWRLLTVTAAFFLFALLAGGPLAWGAFYLCAGIAGFSLVWAWHVPPLLECGISCAQRYAERGERLKVQVWVENGSLLPVTWVELHEDAAEGRVSPVDLHIGTDVGPGETRMDFVWLHLPKRGVYRVGPLRVAAGDPFGLFTVRSLHASTATVTVLPKVHPLDGMAIPLGQPFGPQRTASRVFEDPSNLAHMRAYQPGDNPRHIDWKATARHRALQIREFELHATTSLAILLDLHGATEETGEVAVEAAASLADHGLSRNLEVELFAYGGERLHLPPTKGPRQRARLLETLSRAGPEGAPPPAHLLLRETPHLSHRSTLCVVTTAVTPEAAGILLRLAARQPVMLVMVGGEAATAVRLARGMAVFRLADGETVPDLPRRRVEPDAQMLSSI